MASLSGKVQICNTTLYPFQRTLREYRVQPETPIETLWTQLRLARLDDYQRRTAKTSRAYPRKKRRPPSQPSRLVAGCWRKGQRIMGTECATSANSFRNPLFIMAS